MRSDQGVTRSWSDSQAMGSGSCDVESGAAMEVALVPRQEQGLPGKKYVRKVSEKGKGYEFREGVLDWFRIKIPGEKHEHVISSTYVRSIIQAADEVIGVYANSLNLSMDKLQIAESDIMMVFADILREFSVESFREDVKVDAADFVVSEEILERDLDAYRAAGCSLEVLVARIQKSKAEDRFNTERCTAVFSDDPEYERLMSLARDGVIIDSPEGFILQTEPEVPRKLQRQLDLAYQKHAFKVCEKRNGVIIRQKELSQGDREKLHYNPPHITPKYVPGVRDGLDVVVVDRPMGSRFLMDCSNSESGRVLNTPDVKVKVIERYGMIEHPTIQFIVTEWYAYAAMHKVSLCDCRIFKDDFSGAFAQLNVNPTSAYLLAMLVGAGLILIYVAGLFGWLGFPMAFAVLSRAFQRKFRMELEIPLVLYVDDVIALALAERAVADQQYIVRECERAMGSKAMSFEKQVTPTLTTDVLGWRIDLVTESFRPCEKGTRKLVFAFWLVAAGDEFPLLVYQLLASLAQHYSLGLPGMAPFTYPLHNMVAKFQGNLYWKKKPSSAARLSIEVWRVVSMLLLQKHHRMCRPLRCLVAGKVSGENLIWVFTDASPSGMGIGLFNHENVLLAFMGYQFPFDAMASEYQCAREYFAYMFGFIFLEWVLGGSPGLRRAAWVNDNKAAVLWAEAQKCNSMAAQYAFMAVTWQQLSSQFEFVLVEHQKGVLMGDIDGLSRGYSHSLDPRKEYIMSDVQSAQLDELFLLLDPSVIRDLKDHHYVFDAVITITRALCQGGLKRLE